MTELSIQDVIIESLNASDKGVEVDFKKTLCNYHRAVSVEIERLAEVDREKTKEIANYKSESTLLRAKISAMEALENGPS
jgi:hypothetical protein